MEQSYILPIHKRLDVSFTKGKGVNIFDESGKKYLDFGAGIAVNALGHCHPALVKAIKKQSKKLWHVSNAYKINELEELAKIVTQNSFADYAFFCNSGAEAVECAIKMARKYFYDQNKNKFEIITFKGSFHGRTMATISASCNQNVLKGFGPKLPGFKSATFNDIESVKKLINDKTAAILMEPIQGEGGIIPATRKFMSEIRKITKKHDILLALDEVQCGVGRTGYLYGHEYYGIKPDILASAKGIGGGFPVGACLATKEAAKGMTIGTHGTTYGGNPLAMKVSEAVFNEVLKKGFLQRVTDNGLFLQDELKSLKVEFPNIIKEIRGVGLMIGCELNEKFNNLEMVNKLKDNGLLVIAAAKNTIRFIPPLITSKKDILRAIKILKNSLTLS
ncbi:aspartate aminotransferase family protein [Rickettsiales bacterium]|nr:aspartate aminotransferase family protein [Rickettsiales bacterium]